VYKHVTEVISRKILCTGFSHHAFWFLLLGCPNGQFASRNRK